ncbi:MAG: hypothetical protein ABI551_07405 [Polyangiaceae bacterium]
MAGVAAVVFVACGGASPSPTTAAAVSGGGDTATAAIGANAPAIACGDFHDCARMANGTVRCWGRNRDGELGDGGAVNGVKTPASVAGLSDVAQVAVGSDFSCARFTNGTVSCWGSGKILGDGNDVQKVKPSPVKGITGAVDLQAGGYVACVKTRAGAAKCWGLDAVVKGGPTSGVAKISASGAHACVLTDDGTVKCWGEGAWAPTARPTFADPPVSSARALSSGDSFACTLAPGGAVSCFGRNEQGELGANPDEDNHITPVAVRDVAGIAQIASAESHTCAVGTDGSLTCWGSNTEGELGRGTTTTQELAAKVSGLSNVVAVAPGADHVCATTRDGATWCWGANKYGQIGDGTTDARLRPVKIDL